MDGNLNFWFFRQPARFGPAPFLFEIVPELSFPPKRRLRKPAPARRPGRPRHLTLNRGLFEEIVDELCQQYLEQSPNGG
ncbi:hypothetical protein CEXT_430591 [Caerostris extrusa]|uniref:Uncharacterized protein n=1 Tax=Caerostris extrusa TaxID=172846 RepID=A0AAV4V8S9_CAEEX|nr:hypothetical protein CEXT_430591 [Caerostris extrusa]